MYKHFFKRFFDILLSATALALLFPVFLAVAFMVKIKLGSPVIFKQLRPGKNAKVFKMYKFRTMTNEKDENGNLLPDEQRLTKFGKFLRSTSLDELPEIWNILKGDMSIVGPRPQLVRDMVFFSPEVMARQSVRPGLTGLAQVNGRNRINWEERFEWDLKYIKKITLFSDIAVFFKTIGKMLKRSDISAENSATDTDYGDWLLESGRITNEEYLNKMEEYKSIINSLGGK